MTMTGIPYRQRPGWLRPLLLALAIAAPAQAAGPTGDGGTTAESRTYTVAFAQDTLANDWRTAQVREVAQALAGHPEVRFIHTDAEGQTAKQIMDIEDLLAQGVDVLITSPRDSQALTPVISRAYRQGTPVILLSRRIESEDYTLFIGHDDREIGRRAARRLAERLDGSGRIVILLGIPTASTTKERTAGFIEEIRHHAGLSIAAMRTANYLRGEALLAMEAIIDDHIHFDAIHTQSDSMATGVRLALEGNGYAPGQIPIVGIDYITEAREAIRAGAQDASFTYATGGREGGEAALKILAGETVPKQILLESEQVTADNVERVPPIF